MNKLHDPKASLFDILNCSKKCISYTQNMSFENFEKNSMAIDSVQYQLMIMGEATKRIPLEFRKKYPDIPWKEMAGTRDVLIHAYEQADLEIVWGIVTEKAPELILKIEKILYELEN